MTDLVKKVVGQIKEFFPYPINKQVTFKIPEKYIEVVGRLAAHAGYLRTVGGERVPDHAKMFRDIILFGLTHVDQLISWRVQHYRLLAEQKEQE